MTASERLATVIVEAWTGREIRALRDAQRLSVRDFAARLGVAERTVSRWEAAGSRAKPRGINQEGFDSVLAKLSNGERSRFAALVHGQDDSEPETAVVVGLSPPRPPVPASRPTYGAVPVAESDVLAMQSFRSADRQVGGGHLYGAVVRYLHSNVAPRLFGSTNNAESPAVFTAAAALTEMAGWMAHDAGRDDKAHSHFERALDLSRAGQDRQLSVHVLASLSHLAHHRTRHLDAMEYAQAAEQTLAGTPNHPELSARVLAMQARTNAALGRVQEMHVLLTRAETALGGVQQEAPSEWVSRFDEGSLASEAARCMRSIGDTAQAQREAERIIALRPADRTRSRAFGQLQLAAVLIDRGELEQACTIAGEALDATQSLGSSLVSQQLQGIEEQLAPYESVSTVRDFMEILSTTLRQRLWLQQWLGTEDGGQDSSR